MATNQKMTAVEIEQWIEHAIQIPTWGWMSGSDLGEIADRIPRSDMTAAEFLYNAFQGSIRYIPGLNRSGSWYCWNGVYHEQFDGEQLPYWMSRYFAIMYKRKMNQVKERYEALAATCDDDKERKALMNDYLKGTYGKHREFRDRLFSNAGNAALITQVKHIFTVEDTYFADDRRWLVFLNGVLDLDDVRHNPPALGDLHDLHSRLLDHDPSRAVYRCVQAEFNPEADWPRWREFLEKSLPDADSRRFLATLCGMSLMGLSKTKYIPVLQGRKDSGKSVFVDTICKLYGAYSIEPDVKVLNKSDSQNFEQDLLRGRRFVSIVEPDTDRRLDEPFIKRFTGGDVMSTRTLNSKPVQWVSQGIICVATNSDLKFNTSDRSILDRICTVTFPNKFYPMGEVPEGMEDYVYDLLLEEDLAKEGEGILNWVLNGMTWYLTKGVNVPESVKQNREQTFSESNEVVRWYLEIQRGESDTVTWDPNRTNASYMTLAMAWEDYTGWCYRHGENPRSHYAFSKALRSYNEDYQVQSGGRRLKGALEVAKDY